MKLRLLGTRQECDRLTALMSEALSSEGDAGPVEVLEVSDFYPNRGVSVLGRVYVEVRLSTVGSTPAVTTEKRQVQS